MTLRRQLSTSPKTLAFAAAILIAASAAASTARASYLVTLSEQGSNVVANGTGSVDITGLNDLYSSYGYALIDPSTSAIGVGPSVSTSDEIYSGVSGPANFGSGALSVTASSGTGDLTVMQGQGDRFALPASYVSGDPLAGTATWDNQSFASLGVTPGTYVWTWGTGAHADSFTLKVASTAVPEPGALALFATALIGLGVLLRGRRGRTDAERQICA